MSEPIGYRLRNIRPLESKIGPQVFASNIAYMDSIFNKILIQKFRKIVRGREKLLFPSFYRLSHSKLIRLPIPVCRFLF